jgi:hypothetical protein
VLPALAAASSDGPSARLVTPGRDPGATKAGKATSAGLTDVKYWR